MLLEKLHIEDMSQEYSYNCFMLETPFKNWNNLLDKISGSDLYIDENGGLGKENESHITILYGLHGEISFESIKELTDSFGKKNVEYKITGIGKFSNDDFDVLKLNIESDDLNKLNSLACVYPYTNDYDTYHPHMTLAYLKKGMADKYLREINNPIVKTSNKFSYSTVNKKKYYWDL